MTWLADRVALARLHLGRSVLRLNPDLAGDALARSPDRKPTLVGFKDDPGLLSSPAMERLRAHAHYLWLTVDRAAAGLRSIDPGLVNPLTGLVMTGSSSGTAANVYLGVVDAGVGTDSGGSVLGPALSVQRPAMIAGGLGLTGQVVADSAHGPSSLGVIAGDLTSVARTVAVMAGEDPDWLLSAGSGSCTIGYPERGCLVLPSGIDSGQVVEAALGRIGASRPVPVALTDPQDRDHLVEQLLPALTTEMDIFVSFEGPVNVFAAIDSIAGGLGPTGRQLQGRNGRYVLRAANRLSAVAVAVPAVDLCSGFVVVGQASLDGARSALRIAAELAQAAT